MAEGTIERIQIILQAMTSKFSQGLDKAMGGLRTFGKNIKDFGTVMKSPMDRFKTLNGKLVRINY